MSSFRTTIPPVQSELFLSHQHLVMCIGSCFAKHIGDRLKQLKFPVLINPSGILYNPVSVARVLEKLLTADHFTEADLFEHQGLWHSFAHHSRFSHPDRSVALALINESLQQGRHFLKNTNRLILTLGTAHVFVYKETGAIVANCHKMPGQAFDRCRLSVKEVVTLLVQVLKRMKEQLPALEVIVTVSPVRHLRDGLVENQRSKATLLLGLDEVCAMLPFAHYFPSYEIVLDDLRDYRFYEKDLSHPNELAVDYIWQYFEEAFFSKDTMELVQRISRLKQALAHRPFQPASPAHQSFLKSQLEVIKNFEEEHALLDFTAERALLERQLI